jgi:DNA-binding winged helix-turn-helix (wHTH) protein
MTAIANDPHIDPERRRVRCGAGWRRLQNHPWQAFERLMERRGHVVRRGELAAAVWPGRIPDSEHVVRQLVCDLRRQLRGSPFGVVTWTGIGYEIEVMAETGADTLQGADPP